MELISQKVTHIRFGEGFIVNKTDNRIGIHFSDPIGLKVFVFPDAFVQYLWMEDHNVQEYVINQYYQNQRKLKLKNNGNISFKKRKRNDKWRTKWLVKQQLVKLRH